MNLEPLSLKQLNLEHMNIKHDHTTHEPTTDEPRTLKSRTNEPKTWNLKPLNIHPFNFTMSINAVLFISHSLVESFDRCFIILPHNDLSIFQDSRREMHNNIVQHCSREYLSATLSPIVQLMGARTWLMGLFARTPFTLLYKG